MFEQNNDDLIVIQVDTKSNVQVSHKAHGPFSWYYSIELIKLNNFCSKNLKDKKDITKIVLKIEIF